MTYCAREPRIADGARNAANPRIDAMRKTTILGGIAVTAAVLLLSSGSRAADDAAGGGESSGAQVSAADAGLAQISARALRALASSMSDAGAALAADDFARYVDRQARVRDAFRDLVEFDPECARSIIDMGGAVLPSRDNMADARVDFARFSTAVADVVRSRQQLRAAGMRLFECRMAPVVGTARWLQREASPRNPFFGDSMLECGTELDAVSVARTLPPGHPPIGHLSADERAMYAGSGNVAAAGGSTRGGCGSCGMSMEAMAAGEPCEHDKK